MRFSFVPKLIPTLVVAAAVSALMVPSTASAQFSDSYNFLQGVRDRDFAKVQEIIEQPSSIVINVRDRGSGDAALHIVTRERDTQWVLYLLRNRANPNIRDREGNTALHIAARIGFGEAVRFLNIVNADVDARNNRGETPLVIAVQSRHAAVVRQLVDAGANPDIADSVIGRSARDYAARDSRSAEILTILESAAAPEESQQSVGPSPN
jgi:ankyrin repeat protein